MTKKASRKSTGGASFYYFQAAETLYSGGKSVKRRIKREEKELSSFYFFLDKNALRECKDKLKEKEGVSSFCVFVLKTYKQRNGRKRRRSIDVISSLYVFGSNTGRLAHVLLAVWIDLPCARTGLLAQTMHISTSANFDFTSFYQLIRSKNGFRDRKRQKFTNCLQIPTKTSW